MALPKTLKNFTLYVDGVGYAGKVTEGAPPKVTIQTEDFEAGGLSGVAVLDMGAVEKLETSFTVAEFNPELYALLGKRDVLFTLRGAQGETGTEEPVIYQMRGVLNQIEPEAFKRKAQGAIKVMAHPAALKITIGSREVVNIDIEANTRVIGGVDQMAGIRTALGQ